MQHLALLIIFACNLNSIRSKEDDNRKTSSEEVEIKHDWLPHLTFKTAEENEFKNFIQEERKRLRRQAFGQFGLRAVAEPDSDDYYDKGQGESDGEDYYERREWSDVYRPAEYKRHHGALTLDHSDLVDIDGIGISQLYSKAAPKKEDKVKETEKKVKTTEQITESTQKVQTTAARVEIKENKKENISKRKAYSKVKHKTKKLVPNPKSHAATIDTFKMF